MIRGSFHTIIGTGHRTFPVFCPGKVPTQTAASEWHPSHRYAEGFPLPPFRHQKAILRFHLSEKKNHKRCRGRGLSTIFRGRIYPLLSNPVCCNDRHHICRRMPLHTAPPVRHTVTLNNRLGAYRRRIKQKSPLPAAPYTLLFPETTEHQQIPTPIFAYSVSHTRKPVFPGVK